MAAPINLSFEDQGANPGEADGWTATYVSTARGLASFPLGAGQAQAVEDFEQGWDNDDFLFTMGPTDKAAAVFDGPPLPQAQTFEDFEEGWGAYFFESPPTAAAVFAFGESAESFEEHWDTVSATFTASAIQDKLFSSNHGLLDGRVVQLTTTGSLPPPLDNETRYYVVNAAQNDFQVSLSAGGPIVNIGPGGSGTHTWTAGHLPAFETELSATAEAEFNGGPATSETFEAGDGWDAGYETSLSSTAVASFGASGDPVEDFEDVKDLQVFTVTVATDTINATGHGFLNGDRVTLESTGALPAGLSLSPRYFVTTAFPNTFQVELTLGGGAVAIGDEGSGIHRVRADRETYWTEVETI